MIQRIQTIWLLLSAILSGFLIKGEIVNFVDKSGQKFFAGFLGLYKKSETGSEVINNSFLLAGLILFISLLSLLTIFLYKRRHFQKILCFILAGLSICLILLVTYYSLFLVKNFSVGLIPGVKMIFPLLLFILAILAYIGISKDDRLVKSFDRLR